MAEFIDVPCVRGVSLRIEIHKVLYHARSKYQDIAIYETELFGKCLFLDGVIQCAESDHEVYDRALLERLRLGEKKLLILGGGDGYTAATALSINPNLKITLVDIDRNVVRSCQQHLGQKIYYDPRVDLVIENAISFIHRTKDRDYDGVVCDFTEVPLAQEEVQFKEFFQALLSHSARVLRREGWIGFYAGCEAIPLFRHPRAAETLKDMLQKAFINICHSDVLIPSFGESCFFYFAQKPAFLNSDRSGQ
ncbi:MAG: methyltransferase [Candidatus Aminicenantales bacterium]